MDVGKTIKGYFWWTYPRGSVHYDLMVTLILAFIFVTPFWVNFKDRPTPRPHASVLVEPQGERAFICEVDASEVKDRNEAAVRRQLVAILEPITGTVTIDRYTETRGSAGNKVLKVWVHR